MYGLPGTARPYPYLSPPTRRAIYVVVRYYRDLLHYLVRLTRDRHLAGDLTQESYARVIALQRTGQPIDEPRALLYQIARNLVVDEYRRRRSHTHDHEHLALLPEEAHPAAPAALEPEQACDTGRTVQALMMAIDGLSPRCREAFTLSRLEGLSHADIGQRMGISTNMVAKHVMRGLLVCQQCLDGAPLPADGQARAQHASRDRRPGSDADSGAQGQPR